MEKMLVYKKDILVGEVLEASQGCCEYPIFHAYTPDKKDVFQIFPTSNAVRLRIYYMNY